MTNQLAVAVTNAELYARTRAQAEQLRRLANHVERIREEERSQISREIHDQLGQELTTLKFDVAYLNGRLAPDQAEIGERLNSMQQALDGTIAKTREIAARLRPDVLDRLGLNAAIEWQLQEFRSRTGINYHLTADSVPQRFSVQQSTALFRILQEALTNITRHAQATRVRVRLELLADAVHLSIDDDGGGIDEGKILDAQSLGLLGMRERAAFLGGSVTIHRNITNGTTITARLPLGSRSKTKKWNMAKKVGEP
jgi:signal transduction histidine kinase